MIREALFVLSLVVLTATMEPAQARQKSAPRPESGACTVQPTYAGCRACCDAESRVGGFLTAGCTSAASAGGAAAGGIAGAFLGGAAGGELCMLMLFESNCTERCEGKDGDPSPISCIDPESLTEGVCRQVCEDGAHDRGPAGCPSELDLTCCVHEYDPPEDCPPELCPGIACPPGCDPVSS